MARKSKYRVGSLVETKRGYIPGQGIIVEEKMIRNAHYNWSDGFIVRWFENPKFHNYNAMQWAEKSECTKNQIRVISAAPVV
tara:strand:- start:458 stop:703 length:246 start_codon:yes stop_codon:yes gene_type:complete